MFYSVTYDDIKNKIIDELTQKFNRKLDLSEFSFITQLVNLVAVSDENLLFYLSLLLNESNINSAILPETIQSIGKAIGLSLPKPEPARADIKMYLQVPVDVSTEYYFSEDFVFISSMRPDVKYFPTRPFVVKYDNVSKKSFVYYVDTYEPVLSYIENDHEGNLNVIFNVEVIQLERTFHSYYTSKDLYFHEIGIEGGTFVYDIDVFVDGVKYSYVNSSEFLKENNYTYFVYDKYVKIIFATHFSSKPIPPETKIEIILYTTKGANGNIKSNTMVPGSDIRDIISNQISEVTIKHFDITNGKNPDSMLEYKQKIFNKFTSQDTILSKKSDLKKIKNLIPSFKYVEAVFKKSIAPEFTVFVNLDINNVLINTNSVTLTNVDRTRVEQDTVFKNLQPSNKYSLAESSQFNSYNVTNLLNDFSSCILPFSIEIDEELNLAKYYYRKKDITASFNTEYSVISEIDKVTSIKFDTLRIVESKINPSEYIYNVNIVVNTYDIFNLTQDLEFKVYIKNESEIVISSITDSNSFTIKTDPSTGLIILQFESPSTMYNLQEKYHISIKAFHKGVLISEASSSQYIPYIQMPIKSSTAIVEQFKEFSRNQGNEPEYIVGGDNKTPSNTLWDYKLKFEKNKLTLDIIKNDSDQSGVDLIEYTMMIVTVSYVDPQTDTVTIVDRVVKDIEGSSISSIHQVIALSNLASLDKKFHIEIKVTDVDESKIVYANFQNIDLSAYQLNTKREVYHVPVIKFSDYLNYIKKESPDLPYNRIMQAYNTLDEYVLLGMTHNIKFIKTFGYISTIRFNESYTYDTSFVDTVQLPLTIEVDAKIEKNFDLNKGSSVIISKIKEIMSNNSELNSNFKKSIFEAEIINELDGLFSISITNPNQDIIYDIPVERKVKYFNEYVPELITVNSININFS